MCRAAGGRRAHRGARPCQKVKVCSVLELLYVAPCRGRQSSSLLAGCACTASPLLGGWGEQGGFSSPPESSIPIQRGTGKYSLVRLGCYSQSSFDVSVAGGLARLWRGSRECAAGAVLLAFCLGSSSSAMRTFTMSISPLCLCTGNICSACSIG